MRLLLVADIHRATYDLCAGLESHGFEVVHCDDAQIGLDRACQQQWQVIVLDATMMWKDFAMMWHDALAWLKELRTRNAATPVIVLTAGNDVAISIDLLGLSAENCVSKPVTADDLVARIAIVLNTRNAAEPKA